MNIWDELFGAEVTEEPPTPEQTPMATVPTSENVTAPEGTEGTEIEMRIGTHNIRNFPDIPRDKVRRAAEIAASCTDICGLQEIQEQTDKEDVKRAMKGFDFIALDRRPPIAYRPEIVTPANVGPRGFIQVSEPVPGFMPELGFTVATFQSVKRPNLSPFIVVNYHFPPGAFNPRVKDRKKWRKDTWNTFNAMMRDFVTKWNERGFTVFCVGDANAQNIKPFGPNSRHLHKGSIDYVSVSVGSVGIDVRDRITKNSPSDHNVYAVRGKLINRKRKK